MAGGGASGGNSSGLGACLGLVGRSLGRSRTSRADPIAPYVAAVTGTTGSAAIEAHLFGCADAVVFLAETERSAVARAVLAGVALEAHGRARVHVSLQSQNGS